MTGQGFAAYRAWRQPLRRHTDSGVADAGYAVYVVVALGGVYGSMFWSFVSSLGVGTMSVAWPLDRIALLATGGVALLAALVAGIGAPLWVTRLEQVHALSGQFTPKVVLRGRATGLVVICAAIGALTSAAASSGADVPAGVAGWAIWGGLTGIFPLAVAALAQVPCWRAWAAAGAAAVAALGALGMRAPQFVPPGCADAASTAGCDLWLLSTGSGIVALVVAGVVAALSIWVVLCVVPQRMDVDDVARRGVRSVGVGVGLAAGDALAASRVIQPVYAGRRSLLGTAGGWLPLGRSRTGLVIARDLLGLRRRPVLTLVSTLAGGAGAWLVVHGAAIATTGQAGLLVAGSLLLYAAIGGWSTGLSAFFRQPAPGSLFPPTPRRVMATHTLVPAALLLAALIAAGLPAAGSLTTASTVTVVCIAILATAVRVWTLSSTMVPAALYTPTPSPMGDLSIAFVIAHYLRGWLLIATLAWLTATAATQGAVAWILVLLTAAVCTAVAVRRVQRN